MQKWVLVADDDDLLRELFVEVLADAGYRTVEARTGEAVIELMRVVVPDLLILDLQMPQGSGVDVLHELQGRPVLQAIPVVLVSGFLHVEPHDSIGVNVVASLSKPVRLPELLSTAGRPSTRPASLSRIEPQRPSSEGQKIADRWPVQSG